MNCEYCHQSVFAQQHKLGKPVTLTGVGIAHLRCAENASFSRRIFRSIDLNELTTKDLCELKELLLQEINLREGQSSCELF